MEWPISWNDVKKELESPVEINLYDHGIKLDELLTNSFGTNKCSSVMLTNTNAFWDAMTKAKRNKVAFIAGGDSGFKNAIMNPDTVYYTKLGDGTSIASYASMTLFVPMTDALACVAHISLMHKFTFAGNEILEDGNTIVYTVASTYPIEGA